MVTDSVADILIQLKNGYLANKIEVTVPYSKLKESIVNLLVQYQFVDEVKVKGEGVEKAITVFLKYDDGRPALKNVKQISKPGRRIYRQAKDLYLVRGGYGILLISTPEGLMIGKEAQQKNLGGEVFAEIW